MRIIGYVVLSLICANHSFAADIEKSNYVGLKSASEQNSFSSNDLDNLIIEASNQDDGAYKAPRDLILEMKYGKELRKNYEKNQISTTKSEEMMGLKFNSGNKVSLATGVKVNSNGYRNVSLADKLDGVDQEDRQVKVKAILSF